MNEICSFRMEASSENGTVDDTIAPGEELDDVAMDDLLAQDVEPETNGDAEISVTKEDVEEIIVSESTIKELEELKQEYASYLACRLDALACESTFYRNM